MLGLIFCALVVGFMALVAFGVVIEFIKSFFRAIFNIREPIVQPAKVWIKVDGHTRRVFEHDLQTLRDNGLVFTVEPRRGN